MPLTLECGNLNKTLQRREEATLGQVLPAKLNVMARAIDKCAWSEECWKIVVTIRPSEHFQVECSREKRHSFEFKSIRVSFVSPLTGLFWAKVQLRVI